MDLLIVGLSAALGLAAAFVAVYNQNWIPGAVVLGIGSVLIFGATAGGPGSMIDNLFAAVGLEGIIAAAVGAGVGAYAADRYRAQSKPS